MMRMGGWNTHGGCRRKVGCLEKDSDNLAIVKLLRDLGMSMRRLSLGRETEEDGKRVGLCVGVKLAERLDALKKQPVFWIGRRIHGLDTESRGVLAALRKAGLLDSPNENDLNVPSSCPLRQVFSAL